MQEKVPNKGDFLGPRLMESVYVGGLGRTVNPLAHAYVGSNPTPSTKPRELDGSRTIGCSMVSLTRLPATFLEGWSGSEPKPTLIVERAVVEPLMVTKGWA